ncbi:putative zinc protease [bioreactor metagenome]|uniref:Putative zinc protease n=1 Tax=bioreactor metagenome TaxID=1076179 RepID=A0A645G777_9ZZZZ
MEQVIHLIDHTVTDLKTNGVSNQELMRVKEQLKGNLLLGLESSSSRMSRLGKMEISLGKYVTLEEVVAKIDRTSVEDIDRVIHSIFNLEQRCLTTLGPSSKT